MSSLRRYSELQLTISDKTFGYPHLHPYKSLLVMYTVPYCLVIQTCKMCLYEAYKTIPTFKRNSINDSLKLESFRATVDSVYLFWGGTLISHAVDIAPRSVCSISLIEGVNHLSAAKWISFPLYPIIWFKSDSAISPYISGGFICKRRNKAVVIVHWLMMIELQQIASRCNWANLI